MTAVFGGVAVHGHFDARFEPTVARFAAQIESGDDLGASFALSRDGEMLVDVWAGHLDPEQQSPWQEDSIVNVWSSTKTVSFLSLLVLADRGHIDLDAPVARYWPEFAENGKDQVLVWHILNHAAGLSGLDEQTTPEDNYDWDKMTGLLARQAPWWEPGTATGYHAITQGYLIGELVRRVTGESFGAFVRDELAGPLNADFQVGVREEDFTRIGDLVVPEGTTENNLKIDEDPESISRRTFASPPVRAEDANTEAWRRAEIPAAGGHGNARSLVRLQTALACGGEAFGVRLLSEETAASIMTPRISGDDLVLKVPLTFGLGFGLNRGPIPISPNPNAAFWAGWGGSTVLVDQDARVAMSYVMNKMFPSLLGDTRSYVVREQAYEDLAG